MEVGPIGRVIELLAAGGEGVTIKRVHAGQAVGRFSLDRYPVEGWEVGYFNPSGFGAIAFGRTLEEAVFAALGVLERD